MNYPRLIIRVRGRVSWKSPCKLRERTKKKDKWQKRKSRGRSGSTTRWKIAARTAYIYIYNGSRVESVIKTKFNRVRDACRAEREGGLHARREVIGVIERRRCTHVSSRRDCSAAGGSGRCWRKTCRRWRLCRNKRPGPCSAAAACWRCGTCASSAGAPSPRCSCPPARRTSSAAISAPGPSASPARSLVPEISTLSVIQCLLSVLCNCYT